MKTTITISHSTKSQLATVLNTISGQVGTGVINSSTTLSLRKGYDVPGAAMPAPHMSQPPTGLALGAVPKSIADEMTDVVYDFALER